MKCELCKLDPRGECSFCRMQKDFLKQQANGKDLSSMNNYFSGEKNIAGKYGASNKENNYSSLYEMLQGTNSSLKSSPSLGKGEANNYNISINIYLPQGDDYKQVYGGAKK